METTTEVEVVETEIITVEITIILEDVAEEITLTITTIEAIIPITMAEAITT